MKTADYVIAADIETDPIKGMDQASTGLAGSIKGDISLEDANGSLLARS